MIGQVLEKYEILEKVGEGGMATVYRGRHRTLDREVAIKILHPHLSNNAKNRTRFEREARAIEALDCGNIPQIFDFSGSEAEQCFLITEFIHGPTLSQFLDEVGRVPSEPAALIGIQLCEALAHAHAKGIIHRDIKPENIMIDRTGRVKLMDFGIARILDEQHVTVTGALVGSPAFMSPEQALDSRVDGRSDLFSLGTLLYLVVTGELPFRGTNPSVMLKGIIEGQYTDPIDLAPDIHPGLARVLDRLLRTDPEQRYAAAGDVRADLGEVLRCSGIDPEDPGEEWGLPTYFDDPEIYERRLVDHLVPTLIARGRRLIADRDHATALRVLNRVLTLDDGNPDVIAIIGRMGGGEESRRGGWWLYAAPVVLLVAAVVALAWFYGRPGTAPAAAEDGAEGDGDGMTALEAMADHRWHGTPSAGGGDGGLEDGASASRDPLADDGSDPLPSGDVPDVDVPPAKAHQRPDRAEPAPRDDAGTGAPAPEEPALDATGEATDDGDADAGTGDAAVPVRRPIGPTSGTAWIRIPTPESAGVSVYYRDREGGSPILLHPEAGAWNEPVEIPAGYYEVWAEGEFIETEKRYIELVDGQLYSNAWKPRFKPATVTFSRLPEGTELWIGDRYMGTYPAADQLSVPSYQEQTIEMRAPGGRSQRCPTGELKPNDKFTCRWQ